MTCLVHAGIYQKLPVTVHSKEGLSCHVSPSEGQIHNFSVEHNLNVLMEDSHCLSICKIRMIIQVLSKHRLLKMRGVFLGSGSRLPI